MKRTLIRYRTTPGRADENERLIKAVFEELHARAPDGVRYAALRLADGGFVHLVETQEGAFAIPSLDAFRSFQSGMPDRTIEPPQSSEVTVVGNYRMLAE
jgi:hypothetical protein